MDSANAELLCAAVSAQTGVPVLPAIRYGCSLGHSRRWPGTISLQPNTLTETVTQIYDWIHGCGFRRLFLVNGHVTNAAPLRCALEIIRSRYDDALVRLVNVAEISPRVRAEFFADAEDWHANAAETSLMLALAPDPRPLRRLEPRPGAMPTPTATDLPVLRLSGSAYEDLRRCPYRFFALRQLKLQVADELDLTLDKRDFGNWLHLVLRRFHEALQRAPVSEAAEREGLLDGAATQASAELALSRSEFLPFAAAWPRVRAGYLQWLAKHEAGGAEFVEAEAWKEMALGGLTLVGNIDRIDLLPDGSALVIDYKTEAPGITAQRLKAPLEDTQLAFYAALLADDTLAAAYVNVGEKEGTRDYAQEHIVDLRDQLLAGIVNDVQRIAAGAPLPALGEGKACEFCDARGLCRKDFWSPS